MNRSGAGEREMQQLRQQAAEALRNPDAQSPEQLDALLTECAAQALQLRANGVRVERQLAAVLELAAEVRAVRDGVAAKAIAS